PPGVVDPASALAAAQLTWHRLPAPAPYYDEPDLDAILDAYRRSLDGATFLVPIAALECVRYFEAIADRGLLLLSADKGQICEAELIAPEDPAIAYHGSLSTM